MFKLPSYLISILIFLHLLASGSTYGTFNPNDSAFCQNVLPATRFPLEPPPAHLPWIWDAIHQAHLQVVDIISMTREPCSFNITRWHRMVELHGAVHGGELAYGLYSNIFVHADSSKTNLLSFRNIFQKSFICEFFNSHKQIVFSSTSGIFSGDHSIASMGFALVRCPAPPTSIRFVLLRLISSFPSFYKDPHYISFYRNETEMFPVCESKVAPKDPNAATSAPQILSITNTTQPIYTLSICTAILSVEREKLVEWLEYHFTLGVDHVFLYVTSTQPEEYYSILHYLQDYLRQKKVTVVKWAYQNCVRGMASGRFAILQDKIYTNLTEFFQPPRAIAHSAALSSCYMRFRYSSRYIAHIDVDEFLYLRKPLEKENMRDSWERAEAEYDYNLATLTDLLFSKQPNNIVALKFPSIPVSTCKLHQNKHQIENHRKCFDFLPRLGKVNIGIPQVLWFESKLIVRTDRVSMFFVHYLTQLEYPSESIDPQRHYYYIPLREGGLWHIHNLSSPSLFTSGSTIYQRYSQNCDFAVSISLMKLHNATTRSQEKIRKKRRIVFGSINKVPKSPVVTLPAYALQQMGLSETVWGDISRRYRHSLAQSFS